MEIPEICANGFHPYPGTEPDPVNPEEVEICRRFIRDYMIPAKSKGISSYHLKHVVERLVGRYISPGAFLLAAYREGLEVEKQSWRSPNGWVMAKYKDRAAREKCGGPRIKGTSWPV